MFPPRVLVVDDEDTIRHVLKRALQKNGYEIREAATSEEAISLLADWKPDVAILDTALPGMSALPLLGELKQCSADTEVLVTASQGAADTALDALRRGASDYLKKPFDLQEVSETVHRALEARRLSLRNRALLARRERRHQELLSELSSSSGSDLGESESVREIVAYFLDLVCEEFGAQRASVMLVDSGTNELRIVSSNGIDSVDPDDVRVPIGQGIAGRVAESGEPFLVTDLGEESPMRDVEYRDGSRGNSFISAPITLSVAIKSDRSTLGVINLTDRDSGKAFDAPDVNVLTNLAGQLAAAIEGARRTDRLAHAYESLRETQDQRVLSERIKAVGQMATGVAHDFNNVLSVILARAQFARKRLGRPQPKLQEIDSDLETITDSALQAAELIKRIQDYARIRKDVPNTPVNLNKVVEEAVEMTRPNWMKTCDVGGHPIDFQIDLQPIPAVSGNTFELSQAVGNLILNAIEAMPTGGTLICRTCAVGDSVILEVEDNGAGMGAETLDHVFEPFFTTKEHRQGLGTSIVYGIVARHRGEIRVASEPGRGTRFTIEIPRLSTAVSSEVATVDPAPLEIAPARILLVDDDATVREAYREALVFEGHSAAGVPDGESAIALFEAQRFDVVITDLSLGGMSGLQLSKRLKAVAPEVPVILLSGWAVQQDEQRILDAGIDHVLVKPCLTEDLIRTFQGVRRTPVNVTA